jgi:cytochrome P450
MLVVADTQAIHQVLAHRPRAYRRLSRFAPVLAELGSAGLFSVEEAAWKRQRELIMPAFSTRQQRDLYPALGRLTQNLRTLWLDAAIERRTVDVRQDLMRYTVDATCQLVFGRDLGAITNPNVDLQRHLDVIFSTILRRVNSAFPYWRYIKLPADRAVERALDAAQRQIASLIAETRESMRRPAQTRAGPPSVLEVMLESQARAPNSDEALSDAEISGNVMLLLLAGEDTTADTLTSVLSYVAHEPEVQQRLHDEARAVWSRADSLPSYEDIAGLRYTAAVVNETIRLRSAVPVMFLEAARDVVLADVEIPAGTPIFLLTRYVSGLDCNFADPEKFDPDRWLSGERCPRTHNPRAVLAFGAGPRSCPGRSLALFECALLLSMVARNFIVEPVGGRDAVRERFYLTMQLHGLRVKLEPR